MGRVDLVASDCSHFQRLPGSSIDTYMACACIPASPDAAHVLQPRLIMLVALACSSYTHRAARSTPLEVCPVRAGSDGGCHRDAELVRVVGARPPSRPRQQPFSTHPRRHARRPPRQLRVRRQRRGPCIAGLQIGTVCIGWVWAACPGPAGGATGIACGHRTARAAGCATAILHGLLDTHSSRSGLWMCHWQRCMHGAM